MKGGNRSLKNYMRFLAIKNKKQNTISAFDGA
mgnify:CR=1 FL=1